MKKYLFFLFLLSSNIATFSQSYSDGTLLRPGYFSGAINPVLENKLPGVYVRGSYGISRKMGLNMKYGVFEGADYVGADLEWQLRSNNRMDMSLITGAHALKNFGLDIGLAAGFPVNTHTTLYSGLDFDFNFNINYDRFFWLPLGVKIYLSRNARFIIEADIPLVDFAPTVFGGGFSYNFR